MANICLWFGLILIGFIGGLLVNVTDNGAKSKAKADD